MDHPGMAWQQTVGIVDQQVLCSTFPRSFPSGLDADFDMNSSIVADMWQI